MRVSGVLMLVNTGFRYEVVSCLSEHVRNDTLLEKEHRVEHACRRQLKAELLQRVSGVCRTFEVVTLTLQHDSKLTLFCLLLPG